MQGCKYERLLGRIISICGNRTAFAKLMGMAENTLRRKLLGECDFKVSEILLACKILGISADDIGAYFFKD